MILWTEITKPLKVRHNHELLFFVVVFLLLFFFFFNFHKGKSDILCNHKNDRINVPKISIKVKRIERSFITSEFHILILGISP